MLAVNIYFWNFGVIYTSEEKRLSLNWLRRRNAKDTYEFKIMLTLPATVVDDTLSLRNILISLLMNYDLQGLWI